MQSPTQSAMSPTITEYTAVLYGAEHEMRESVMERFFLGGGSSGSSSTDHRTRILSTDVVVSIGAGP